MSEQQILVKKVNNHVVKPIKTATTLDDRPVKGSDYILNPYANICIVGRKYVGKTVALIKSMWETIGKDTTVILYVGTILNDDTWIETLGKLKQHNIATVVHDSTYEGKGKNKRNLVEDLVEDLRKGNPQAEKPKEIIKKADREFEKLAESRENRADPFSQLFGLGGDKKEEIKDSISPEDIKKDLEPIKPVKGKYLYAKYFIVFDDISDELKNPAISTLLKQNRHYKCRTITSTQYYHDIPKQNRKQMQVFLIFKGQPDDKLKVIYEDADVGMPFETFKSIYDDATADRYSFLYIDKDSQIFRKGFNYEYFIQP